VTHVQKRVFEQIIECSDVGIDPEIEAELAETKAFGLQTGEEEDTSEYAIKVNFFIRFNVYIFKKLSFKC
jgi:hypothetical protein